MNDKTQQSEQNPPKKTFLERFPPITDKFLREYTPNKKDNLAGEYFLERGLPTSLVAGSSMGKSVLAQQVAISLAVGSPLLGRIQVKQKCRVLLLQAENSYRVMKKNHEGIKHYLSLDKVPSDTFHAHWLRGVMGDEFYKAVEEFSDSYGPEVLIVDPYQSFMPEGGISDDKVCKEWTNQMDAFMEKYNFSLFLLNHTNKLKMRNDDNYLEQYMIAGTARMTNWLRVISVLSPESNKKKQTGHLRAYRFSCPKPNDALGVDEKGNELSEFYIEQSGDRKLPYWKPVEFNPRVVDGTDTRAAMVDFARKKPDHALPPRRKMQDDPDCPLFLKKLSEGKVRELIADLLQSKTFIQTGVGRNAVISLV
jgi:RecA-family ATPase